MLKIKDNVDLKELKEFGIEKDDEGYFWKNKYEVVVLRINEKIRKLDNRGDRTGNEVFFDLIQAGLVEKVSDR